MRRKVWIAAFLVSVVLGIAYVFSLFLWTDPKTGFATAGGTGARYLAMLLPVLLAVASGAMVPSDRRFFEKKQTGALLAAVAASSEIYGVGLILAVLSGSRTPAGSHHMTIGRALMGDLAELLLAVLFLLFGLWALLLVLKKRVGNSDEMLYLGVAGSAAFFLHTVLCFLVRPASLHRFPPAVEILAALAALLFVAAYLRAYYLPERPGCIRAVCRSGLIAFSFCTCLFLPQTVWQAVCGVSSLEDVLLAITLGLTGCWGAAVSIKTLENG